MDCDKGSGTTAVDDSDADLPLGAYEGQALTHLDIEIPAKNRPSRRNWIGNVLDGGLFIGAFTLVNAQTLLPTLVLELGGSQWMVSLMPTMMTIGFIVPQIFIAHFVSRFTHFKTFLLHTGVWQRLPYLLAGLILFFIPNPHWCLWAIVLAPLFSGFFGGVGVLPWQQFFARTIPVHRRASVLAWRFGMSSVMGVGAGLVVSLTLAYAPGMRGYGILHLLAFALLVGSYISFAIIREPSDPAHCDPETSLWKNLSSLPTLVMSDSRLARVLISSALACIAGMMVPYLAIFARGITGQSEGFLGQLIIWQMLGAVLGGFGAGWLGDRGGSKLPLQIGRIAFLLVCLVAAYPGGILFWCVLFFVFGAASNISAVAMAALQLDILPRTGRANRLMLINATQLPLLICAPLIGAAAWKAAGASAFPWLSGVSAFCTLASFVVLTTIQEPRTENHIH